MADVAVIYLPPREGGSKQGVDDFLASGNSIEDLLSHATHELREPPRAENEDSAESVQYRATASGLVWDKQTQNGPVSTRLTNFTARIATEVAEDDGAEVKRQFEIEACQDGRTMRFDVPAAKFVAMGWPTEYLGASAVVFPGFGTRDHARTAIQLLSRKVARRRVFTHTGWREIDGAWVYLHSGGAIEIEDATEGIEVRLDGTLSLYALPEPPEDEDLRTAIRASLGLWEVAPDGLAITLHAATFRAILGESDFSVHVAGPTGEGKSELAALFQQHFGSGLDARHLTPWEATENALEAKAFALKDSLMVVDDFAPAGTAYDMQRLHKKADRLMRGKGNASGRERMRSDLSLRPPKPPRALVLSTGEDVPRGQSLRARTMILELSPGDVNWSGLTQCQRYASEGVYARATAGFISWLAPRYGDILRRLPEETRELREDATRGSEHKRTPGIVADLALGLRRFLDFAEDAGAVTGDEAEELRERGWVAITGAAASQSTHQAAGEPTKRFLELLSAAVASGRAHIAAIDGEKPEENAKALGWRRRGGDYPEEWRPQGDRVGWVDGEHLYLEPEASFRTAQSQAQGGDALLVGARTMRKRLKEKGHLVSIDEKRETLTVRRTIEGSKDRSVLHLRLDLLFSADVEPDEPDAEGKRSCGRKQADSSSPPDSPEETWEKFDAGTAPDLVHLAAYQSDSRKGHNRMRKGEDRRVRRVLATEESGNERTNRSDSLAGPGCYQLVQTQKLVEGLAEVICKAEVVAVDLETTGLNPRKDRVRIVSLSTSKGTWLVDCFAVTPSPLFPILGEKKLIFHNALFDLGFLTKMGFELGRDGEVLDTMLMSQATENEGPAGDWEVA